MNKNLWKSSSTQMSLSLSLSMLLLMMMMTVRRCCLWESIHHYIGLVVNLCFCERVDDFVASNSCRNNSFESISLTRISVYKEKESKMQEKKHTQSKRMKKKNKRNQNVKKITRIFAVWLFDGIQPTEREKEQRDTHQTKRNDQKIKHLAAAMCWAKCDERWFVFCMRATH